MTNNKSLKIGFVLDDSLDKSDGVQQYVLNIGSWLQNNGHQVYYLVGQTKKANDKNIFSLSRNINVSFNHNQMSIPLPASRKKINLLLDQLSLDVVHVQMPYSPFMAQKIIYEINLNHQKTAIIGTFHIVGYNYSVFLASKVLAFWTKNSLKLFNSILSVSSAAQSYCNQTFKINSLIVPNVVDYKHFNKASPLQKFNDQSIVNILFLGRLVKRKGCLELLKAVNILNKFKPLKPFRIIICGKGPLETKLKKFAHNHAIDHLVSFEGYISEENKPKYYASAQITVFPSLGGESFGIVLLEALASGRSVVLAGDNPGYKSVLGSHEELLFDPGNSQLFAEKLYYFINNSDIRNKKIIWGQEYAKKYDIPVIGQNIVQFYNQALLKRRRT